MNSNSTGSKKSSGISNKWLVRSLIIIGIGIPVLIELFTFTGLISSHLLGGNNTEDSTAVTETETEKVPAIQKGDTLFKNAERPFQVDALHFKIYPDKWVFTIGVKPIVTANKSYSSPLRLIFSSLRTEQRTIHTPKKLEWGASSDTSLRMATWELESSEKPVGIEINQAGSSSGKQTGKDTPNRYYEMGHIKARYYK